MVRAGRWTLFLVIALAGMANAYDVRMGGTIEATGSLRPPFGEAAVRWFVGTGSLEASSETDLTVVPYTAGNETISLSLIRDWLSLTAARQWSCIPLGITAARITATAKPPAWTSRVGLLDVDAAIAGEARLSGAHFSSTPLRTELSCEFTAGLSRDLGRLGRLRLAGSLHATVSDPDVTQIWPISSLVASLSLGAFTVRSETEMPLAPFRIDAERLTLAFHLEEAQLTAEASVAFARGSPRPSLSIRIMWTYGDAPLGPIERRDNCEGGVCR